MEIVLEKLNGFKKIIFFALCGLYVLLYFCKFINYVTVSASVWHVLAQLTTGFGVCAILALGLIGVLLKKEKLCMISFALLLGSAIYGLIAGFFSGLQNFYYFQFNYYKASMVAYDIFEFLTGAVGTVFAVFAVLNWLLGRDALRKVAGIFGIVWIGMTSLMIIFTIIVVADGEMWYMIVSALYNVARSAFVVILATAGILLYGETAEKTAEKPAVPAEEKAEEQPAG